MFLIRKGEAPRPYCAGCRKIDAKASRASYGDIHVCSACMAKLRNGPGVYIDPRALAVQRAV